LFNVKHSNNICNVLFCNRHIRIMDDDRRDRMIPLRSAAIFRKGHGSASHNSKGLQNGSKKSGLGGNFTPYEGEITTQNI